MSRRDRITKEKERLMKEVLGKKRGTSHDSVDAKEYLERKDKALQEANSVLDWLNALLAKQQKDLSEMSAMSKEVTGGISDETMNQLQKEIEKDFGVKIENIEDEIVIKTEISKALFDEVKDELYKEIIGQNDAVDSIVVAFRRPFVMKSDPSRASNSFIVKGSKGSGRHTLITKMARALYKRQIIYSDEVYTIDMGLYSSSSQEQLFLQDLYMAIKGKGAFICFENFEIGYAPFLRMVNELVTTGKMLLNKRYIVHKGQLVESQTGLVSQAVNSLSIAGKYLVFITDQKVSKVIDSFGTTFMDYINDIVELKPIEEKYVGQIINNRIVDLVKRSSNNLQIILNVENEVVDYIARVYDKENGIESIDDYIESFYKELSEAKLHDLLSKDEVVVVKIKDNKPIATFKEKEIDLIKTDDKDKALEEINKELDNVVGLDMVKDYIKSLQSHILIQERRKQQGMKTSDVSKHMIFTGNPGTGKTTIARLISRYMKAIGALSQGQLVEVTRADLVGRYVGHTAPLTMQVIKSALGGVLFIDEAYSLYRGKDDSFGLEAIDTLVKAMEDYRDDLIVILAGYSKEMSTFLESNSGLKSRFPNVINFPDYTGEELMKIALIIAKSKGYKIDDSLKEPLQEYFTKVQANNSKESGNGRLARNVVEDAILRQSERLIKDSKASIDELILEDFNLD
ncbi:MAG TPA: stage V sporulation protein K [Erysipelotrichaceae bacterium]|nr:stage V sporulation protein K [Erysipelotrichaceae bacterium]